MAEIYESMASVRRTAMWSGRTSSIVKPAVFKCYQFSYVLYNTLVYTIKYSITYKLAIHNTFAELALALSCVLPASIPAVVLWCYYNTENILQKPQ